jgi:tRNA A-37 threonylcarbamoyl transferase component Bud32
MDSSGFPEDTIAPRLETLVHDGSNKNAWKLVGDCFGSNSVLLGRVRCPNHCLDQPPADTIFILKFLPYASHQDGKAAKEIRLLNKAAGVGLAPHIIDSWRTPTGIAIVQEKLDMALDDLLLLYKSLEVRRLIMDSVLDLIRKLHEHGIYHGDAHLGNIMVAATDYPGIGRPLETSDDANFEMAMYVGSLYRYYFIDFGDAGLLEQNVSSRKTKRDYRCLKSSLMNLHYDFPGEGLRALYDDVAVTTEVLKLQLRE